MKVVFSQFNFNNSHNYHKKKKHLPSFGSNHDDTYNLSIGYVNDLHGQTNNMIRILSGLNGDLIVSAGDNDLGDETNEKVHKATVQFLNSANIKATALGNHEMDTTQASLANSIDNTNADFLSVNFHKKADWKNKEDNLPEYQRISIDEKVKKSVIKNVKGEKIGIIGVSPIDLFSRTNPYYHTDCYIDNLDTTINSVQEEVEKLKTQGVNKIIVLSHLGQKHDKQMAQQTSGIDVIIGGHTHELIRGITPKENLLSSKSGEPVILTEAGKDGNYFGLLNLTFDKNGVIVKAQNNIGKTNLFHKNMIYQHIFENILGKPEDIGVIKQAPLPPNSLIEENPHANFVCDAIKSVTNSEIALYCNCSIRNYFHEGIIDTSDIKAIAPFNNKICIAMISEKDIVDAFKQNIKKSYESSGNKPGLYAVSGLNYTINETTHELAEMNFVDSKGKENKIDINNPRSDKFYKLVADDYVMQYGIDNKKLANFDECLDVLYNVHTDMICQYIKEQNQPIVINQTGRIKYIN